MLVLTSHASAQTTSAPGIDVEIINPADGTNIFCVEASETFSARVFVRPGTGAMTCTLACSGGAPTVPGGSANVATGVVDIAFDTSRLILVAAQSNPVGVAADGLIQDNRGEGRIGWALAGDWVVDGNTTSGLNDPCAMSMLSTEGWVFEVTFQAGSTPGSTPLRLRRETDPAPFLLSFADICGSTAFTASNGGIDEIVDAQVLIAGSCADVLFFDGFDGGNTDRWAAAVGSD